MLHVVLPNATGEICWSWEDQIYALAVFLLHLERLPTMLKTSKLKYEAGWCQY